jgi:acetate kinase
MPAEAYTYALPMSMIENDGIRRYGMHGTSHKFVSIEMNKLADVTREITEAMTNMSENTSGMTNTLGNVTSAIRKNFEAAKSNSEKVDEFRL